MRLLAATTNRGKIGEITRILSDSGITVLSPADLHLSLDVAEDGDSFADNAVAKALAWRRACDIPSLADDSGLCVDALGGRPGVHSARFAGPGAGDRENYELLLRLMDGVTDRRARFVCVVALALTEETVITATGQCEGVILTKPVGDNGFGYDPVFLDPASGRTFAQLSDEEKNDFSHRKRALEELKRKLREQGII
ncbi:MAG TPA: RdgB/HAM1 family non-canonical purine NTP pyrophosphatase [Deltaproteobacteria bacterium]|nr:RdgB/HAM1 family non-canonical purine NTP pyrophosphatase [Deltaproteobacteria bacterium]HPR55758.1 RdgB/HAM1 family non-canonical purine NTP pyrophosphatase [Deltaproteobacteria bacterium]HXK47526.1 RdgB/HAM1 family non-canonical purine NTP pyrophosphatase [Deltaproteobacteria bacterium]